MIEFSLVAAALPRAALDGIGFFVVLFALLVYAGIARLRDMRSGMPREEVLVRARKRLPWVMGIMLGACAYVLLRSHAS